MKIVKKYLLGNLAGILGSYVRGAENKVSFIALLLAPVYNELKEKISGAQKTTVSMYLTIVYNSEIEYLCINVSAK